LRELKIILKLNEFVAVHGFKLEIGNWEEQYKSMKAKFLISMFRERLQILFRNGDEITSPSRRIDLGQICSILNHKS
jgi:hypothetical protein